MAAQSGLGLYRIMLLNAKADILLKPDVEAAERAATDALARARAPECRFRWGQSEAGHLLGQALAAQWRFREARTIFTETLAIRGELGDPGVEQTRRLLTRLPS